jgi:DinB superfamily
MDLAPEQLQALDYLRRKGTEAPVARLREHVAKTCGEIETLLDSVPADRRAVSPGPGQWSVHEIVDHLIESHRPAVVQIAQLLDGQEPTDVVAPSLQSPAPYDRPWDDLLAELHGIHGTLLTLLDRADDGTSLDARAPVAMVTKVTRDDGSTVPITWQQPLDWKAYTQGIRGHTAQHRQQILRTLAALGR